MDFYKDWNFWLAIFTAGTALLAIFQTQRQIKLSNKQQLFDSRLEAWEKIDGLLQLFRDASNPFMPKKDLPYELTIPIISFTNNTYLNECSEIIDHELENPVHSKFLIKMEELRVLSKKTRFLFYGEEAELCSKFVLGYQDFLQEMYKYRILIDQVDKNAQKFKVDYPEPRNHFLEKFHEPQYRQELETSYEKIKKIYEEIKQKGAIPKIEKQISLRAL